MNWRHVPLLPIKDTDPRFGRWRETKEGRGGEGRDERRKAGRRRAAGGLSTVFAGVSIRLFNQLETRAVLGNIPEGDGLPFAYV